MHPLDWIGAGSRPLWIAVTALGCAVTLAVLARAERELRRTGGPGIVPFELAEDVREARRILTSWGTAGRNTARRSVRVDFVLLVSYSLLLALLSLVVADRADARGVGWLAAAGAVAGWLALLAGVLDAVEDVALLRTLAAGPGAVPVRVAHRSAQVKFTLVALCVLYVLVGAGLVALAPR